MDLEAVRAEVAKWCVGTEVDVGGEFCVEYLVLQEMPSRAMLRKDWYQKWKELPRIEHDYPSMIDDVCQPVDYSAEVYNYPGFAQKYEQVVGNSEWFYQGVVQERNDGLQRGGEGPWYTETSKAATEVDILIPVKFAVLNCDKALRKCRVQYKGEPVLEMSVETGQLPRVLLLLEENGHVEVEICGRLEDLKERGLRLDVGEGVDKVTLEAPRR